MARSADHGARLRGASRALLELMHGHRAVGLVSAALTRVELLRERGLAPAEVDAILNGLAAVMGPVRVHYLWRPRLRDADDDMMLEVAVNGRADAIVTFNLRDFGAVPAGFGIEVLRPAEAIRRLIG